MRKWASVIKSLSPCGLERFILSRLVAQQVRQRPSPSILTCRAKKLFQDFLAQGFRAQDFDVRAVFQGVEDEFPVIGIGDFEDVVAVLGRSPLPSSPDRSEEHKSE